MITPLVNHPLFGLLITLIVYQLALELNQRTRTLLTQPVLATILIVVGLLWLLEKSGIHLPAARDFTLGLNAHAAGTALCCQTEILFVFSLATCTKAHFKIKKIQLYQQVE